MKKTNGKEVGKAKNTASENAGKLLRGVGAAATKIGGSALGAGSVVVEKAKSVNPAQFRVNPENMLRQAVKLPFVKVERDLFLKKELIKYYSGDVVGKAIDHNPAFAGIEREKIDEIAKQIINYETNRVSAISFTAGMPGGLAMAATVPADIAQYFGAILRVMQKLAYLYGFGDFEFGEEEVSDDTLNQIMVFLGAMMGVQGANAGVKAIAEAATQKVAKNLAQKALTKTTVYPIVKKVAQAVGVKITKEIFAKNVSKVVPVVGGVVSGGITYATFKPSAERLQKNFQELKLSDPAFYKEEAPIETE